MKIGIFAGTFDPIHNGHLEFAQAAIQAAQLEKVIIVAEKNPYRKKPHATWDHRQAMIERATETILQVDHDYGFAAALAHQHTMKDMLEKARLHYGESSEIWFLVGSDLFEHMHQWHNLVKAEHYGGFVVALRDDHTKEWVAEQKQKIPEIVNRAIIIPSNHPHISSSKIREAARLTTVPQNVPAAVATYIGKHNLYI